MFRTTSKNLVSPYFRFLMETKGTLKGIPILERAPAMAKLYKELSPKQKAALVARAKKTKYFVNPPKRAKPHTYHVFLKAYAKKKWVAGNSLSKWGAQAKKAGAAFSKYKQALAEKGGKLSYKLDGSILKKL